MLSCVYVCERVRVYVSVCVCVVNCVNCAACWCFACRQFSVCFLRSPTLSHTLSHFPLTCSCHPPARWVCAVFVCVLWRPCASSFALLFSLSLRIAPSSLHHPVLSPLLFCPSFYVSFSGVTSYVKWGQESEIEYNGTVRCCAHIHIYRERERERKIKT